MEKIASLSEKDRRDLFSETASRMHITNAIVEKDFWVVYTLKKLFSHDTLSKILLFKGGTSLSKVFGLIERFSEDIDLILDWKELTDEDPYEERSNTKQDTFNKELNQQAQVYIKDTLYPMISDIMRTYCSCSVDEDDGFKINIVYPALFMDPALLQQILLEIGPLASWVPSDTFNIKPFAAIEFPDKFTKPSCTVNAILAKRTFWEKATILHVEAHRPADKPMPSRYSRHYYDLAMMANSSVKDDALSDMPLLEEVANFKKKFYMRGWAQYDEARSGTIRLIPSQDRVKELEKDFKNMESMFIGKKYSFEEILTILKKLETEIHSC